MGIKSLIFGVTGNALEEVSAALRHTMLAAAGCVATPTSVY